MLADTPLIEVVLPAFERFAAGAVEEKASQRMAQLEEANRWLQELDRQWPASARRNS